MSRFKWYNKCHSSKKLRSSDLRPILNKIVIVWLWISLNYLVTCQSVRVSCVVQYTTDKDGSVMGVTVARAAMLSHCRMLTQACNYTEGENMVCVLDFKRETGLWHSVLTSVLNGMHVVFIPYALMKVNPASWMQMITKYRGLYSTLCCVFRFILFIFFHLWSAGKQYEEQNSK